MLIGADGLASAVRASFYPNEGNPVYSGQMLWRGVTDWEPVFDGRSCVMIGPQRSESGDLSNLRIGTARRPFADELGGGATTVGFAAAESGGLESPRRPDRLRRPAFADWRFDWLDVPALFAATEQRIRIPDGRSQSGAALDVRARHIARRRRTRDAPERIQRRVAGHSRRRRARRCAATRASRPSRPHCSRTRTQRLEPTAKLTLDNRETGPERVLQMVEDRCPNGFADIHDHFSDAELGEIAERYKKLAGFNRDALAAPAQQTSQRGRSMSIWFAPPDLAELNRIHKGTAVSALGIRITAAGEDSLSGTMPVDQRTQAAVGAVARRRVGAARRDARQRCVDVLRRSDEVVVRRSGGQREPHARRSRRTSFTGVARPIHLGRTSHVWGIEIRTDDERLVCIARLTATVIPAPGLIKAATNRVPGATNCAADRGATLHRSLESADEPDAPLLGATAATSA